MRTLFTLLCILSLHEGVAQSWVTGARWFYYQQEVMPTPATEYLAIEKVGDTILQDHEYSVLQQREFGVLGNTVTVYYTSMPFMVREDGQQVYQYNPMDGQDYLLYDFSKNAGDTLVIYAVEAFFVQAPFELTLVIDSVTTDMQGSEPLKVQWVRQLEPSQYRMEGPLTERIGWNEYFFPRNGFSDPPPGGGLLCFRDSVLTYPENAADCAAVVPTYTPAPLESIAVFPNPTPGAVTVHGAAIHRVEVYDRFFRFLEVAGVPAEVDLSGFADGVYFLRIKTVSGQLVRKVIKIREFGQ